MGAEKIMLEKSGGEYRQCRIPGIVRTKTGALLAYYECRRDISDWAEIDLKIIRSTDEGKTWSLVKKIPGASDTLNNPVAVVCGEKIFFLYCKNYKQIFVSGSDDDGVTFTDGKEIEGSFSRQEFFFNALAIGPGHGVFHNGNIIIPVWFSYNRENPEAHRPSSILTIYSKDMGKTWHMGEKIGENFLINPSECALAVTKNEVIISIRNENPVHLRGISRSLNGYERWSDVKFSEILPDPICQGSMDTDGESLFHINCDSQKSRENLTLKISRDEFESYIAIKVDEGGGYSDIAVTDEKIYVIYEKDIDNDGLYFKVIERRNYDIQ